mgnify:FL=1
MITIITKVIIAQMDRFFKNSFNLLFVERKFGKIKINTAIKKIADIIWLVSIYVMNFSKIF